LPTQGMPVPPQAIASAVARSAPAVDATEAAVLRTERCCPQELPTSATSRGAVPPLNYRRHRVLQDTSQQQEASPLSGPSLRLKSNKKKSNSAHVAAYRARAVRASAKLAAQVNASPNPETIWAAVKEKVKFAGDAAWLAWPSLLATPADATGGPQGITKADARARAAAAGDARRVKLLTNQRSYWKKKAEREARNAAMRAALSVHRGDSGGNDGGRADAGVGNGGGGGGGGGGIDGDGKDPGGGGLVLPSRRHNGTGVARATLSGAVAAQGTNNLDGGVPIAGTGPATGRRGHPPRADDKAVPSVVVLDPFLSGATSARPCKAVVKEDASQFVVVQKAWDDFERRLQRNPGVGDALQASNNTRQPPHVLGRLHAVGDAASPQATRHRAVVSTDGDAGWGCPPAPDNRASLFSSPDLQPPLEWAPADTQTVDASCVMSLSDMLEILSRDDWTLPASLSGA